MHCELKLHYHKKSNKNKIYYFKYFLLNISPYYLSRVIVKKCHENIPYAIRQISENNFADTCASKKYRRLNIREHSKFRARERLQRLSSVKENRNFMGTSSRDEIYP